MIKNPVKLYCVAYYQKDLNELRSFDFPTYTECTDKKDQLDVAIRNWETYWANEFGQWPHEWLIMDIWSTYCGGQYRELVARRFSRRCPPQFRSIVEERDMLV
jgi:hypothetical protein